jgi:hypothetical protein
VSGLRKLLLLLLLLPLLLSHPELLRPLLQHPAIPCLG